MAAKFSGTLRTDSKTSQSEEIKHLYVGMWAMIASYYRLAVQRNKGDVNAIMQAVNATRCMAPTIKMLRTITDFVPDRKIRGGDIKLTYLTSASHDTIPTIFQNEQWNDQWKNS